MKVDCVLSVKDRVCVCVGGAQTNDELLSHTTTIIYDQKGLNAKLQNCSF